MSHSYALNKPSMSQLHQKQLEAIQLLAAGQKQNEVASRIGVNRKTIERWMKIPEFAQAVTDASNKKLQNTVQSTSENISVAIDKLLPKAVRTVYEVLDAPDTKVSDKLRAAQILGKWGGLEKNTEPEHKTQPELDLKAYFAQLTTKN